MPLSLSSHGDLTQEGERHPAAHTAGLAGFDVRHFL